MIIGLWPFLLDWAREKASYHRLGLQQGSEVYAMVQCNAHYLPNRAYFFFWKAQIDWLHWPIVCIACITCVACHTPNLAFDRKQASNPWFWTHRSQRDSPKAALFNSDPYIGVFHAQGPIRRVASKRENTHKDNVSLYHQNFLAQRPLSTQSLCSLILRYNILGGFVQLQSTSNRGRISRCG